jgi:hypothetical protein
MLGLIGQPCVAQSPDDIRELKLKDWQPKSMLKTKVTRVEKPMYPVIDVHNHLGGGKDRLKPEQVAKYLTEMNEAGIRTVVNLDGGWGEKLTETIAALDLAHPGRFLTYTLINFDDIDSPNWGEREAARLEESFKAGAKGLKFHKTFGLRVRFKDGKLLRVERRPADAAPKFRGKRAVHQRREQRGRALEQLLGHAHVARVAQPKHHEPVIVVAHDLTPSDTVQPVTTFEIGLPVVPTLSTNEMPDELLAVQALL